MSETNCFPTIKIRLFFLALAFALISFSCRTITSSPHHFDNPAFSFDYPKIWQTMEELWGFEYLEDNYYGLGMQEIIMVTSASKKGGTGAYFAVASKALTEGETLESLFHSTYDPIKDDFREVSEKTTTVNGVPAFEISYQRPWGEPWWQFRDVWLEKEGAVFLLSFHCPPGSVEKYQEDLDYILNSFSLK